MAEKRSVNKNIIRSDSFLALPISAQYLYLQLMADTDDEGLVGNGRSISRLLGCSEKDLDALQNKNFVFAFPSGVIVIIHWFLHNTTRKDRRKESIFPERHFLEKLPDNTYKVIHRSPLFDNQMATKWQPADNQLTTGCQPDGNQVTTNCQPIVRQISNGVSAKNPVNPHVYWI